jgi:hypothetical protein
MSFSCENKDEATLGFMKRTSIDVRQPISTVTMPLLNAIRGRIWATGVLLQIMDKHFILTAAHVFDNWTTKPIPINITDGVNGNDWFLVGHVTLRRFPTDYPHNRLIDEPTDACVSDISQEAAERIASGGRFRFLELSEVDPWSQEDLRSWYMVFGFPGELNKNQIAPNVVGSNACAYASFIYGGERGNIPWRDIDRGVGILMDYGPSTTQNDEGQLVRPPDPRGMSGGGMWRIAGYGTDPNDWSLTSLKLVGIQSSVYEPQQVLRGTRIELALGMIYRGHEDLRPEMERHFGRNECRRWLN